MPARSRFPGKRERFDGRQRAAGEDNGVVSGEAREAGEQGEAATWPVEWGVAAWRFSLQGRDEKRTRGKRTRGDGSRGLPSLRGRAEIFLGARALSFWDEVD
jgi:hypothetical protein